MIITEYIERAYWRGVIIVLLLKQAIVVRLHFIRGLKKKILLRLRPQVLCFLACSWKIFSMNLRTHARKNYFKIPWAKRLLLLARFYQSCLQTVTRNRYSSTSAAHGRQTFSSPSILDLTNLHHNQNLVYLKTSCSVQAFSAPNSDAYWTCNFKHFIKTATMRLPSRSWKFEVLLKDNYNAPTWHNSNIVCTVLHTDLLLKMNIIFRFGASSVK